MTALRRAWSRYVLLGFIAVIITLGALMFGSETYSPLSIVRILITDTPALDAEIFYRLRIPRVLLTLVVGASLSLSGAVFQSLLRNPLADPYVIGVSSGAALGAMVGIVLYENFYLTTVTAFFGGLATVSMVYLISRRARLGTPALILSGIALGMICNAGVLLFVSLSRSDDVHRAMMWLMGDLAMARYDMTWAMAALAFTLGLVILFHAKHCDILGFGERFSRNLGVGPRHVRLLFWCASLLAAAAVSLAGVIGFVGLIVPHIMRGFFGPRHARLAPLSMLSGGLFLTLCDTIGRALIPPYEIPVGIITGICGGIFFLAYLINRGDARG
jgi:iron complex transport system permease protein